MPRISVLCLTPGFMVHLEILVRNKRLFDITSLIKKEVNFRNLRDLFARIVPGLVTSLSKNIH